jgi:hypothetical protein
VLSLPILYKYLNQKEASMQMAIYAYKKNPKIRSKSKAAEVFGVPESTFREQLSGVKPRAETRANGHRMTGLYTVSNPQPSLDLSCHPQPCSRSLKVETPSQSTQGTTLPQTGKYCPTPPRLWEDCQAGNRQLPRGCNYLQLAQQDAPQLFCSRVALKDIGQRFGRRPLSSEQDERVAKHFPLKSRSIM